MLHQTTLNPPLPRELWLKRLHYRSWHRGCKETDLVLGSYCTMHLEGLSESELNLFETFLDEDDSDIWNWLTDKTPCPKPEYSALLDALKGLKLQS
jgi:antitoxin CptB